ncbi:MAG: hypothetical protein GTN86_11820 [Xanthomonadales bacterium]|nr:hypothetical protein [Xanthomonadales bacterium]NIN60402.1 hypothetical protein [Xanthomonadales bacterium]NIN75755.1 hypothetical protein [Xanthomonadales bacterium]NIO14317.1 hypothetical protein [Xanthomonadales bacterium]NIP12795.1 hypothetical protein [Xanthomonadales bacterium]
MTGHRLLVHAAFLYLLPLVVATFGLSVATALALVALALLWRWLISLSVFLAPARVPELELQTITASHFVEKVRWCMDRLGLEYTERPAGGALGAFFVGRTVPCLKVHTGAVRSSIGNSPEILRYLWGRYGTEPGIDAAFLEPTPERVQLEQRLDRYGVDLQVWVYFHLQADRDLTLRAWGVDSPQVPAWQRRALRLAFPVLRRLIRHAFRISPRSHARAVEKIAALLADVEGRLQRSPQALLGGEAIDYTDLAYAAFTGLWLQPERYGGGKATATRLPREELPPAMRAEIEAWIANYPRAVAHVERLYREQRLAPLPAESGEDAP